MTVASSTSRIQYNCSGGTTYAFAFGVGATSEIQVILTNSAGVETILTETTNYTVTATNSDFSAGGTVTTVAAYAVGNKITILRNVPATQESDFVEGMPALYETFEDAVDKLTRICQQQQEELDRTPKQAKTSTTTARTMPEPETGKAVGWDSGGELTNLSGLVETPVTTYTAGFLESGDAEAARTSLGMAFSAQSILATGATTTPAAVAVAESRVVGRVASGIIDDLTLSQVLDMVGSAADGDILYRSGGIWARLPKGTAAQVLIMNVGATAPKWETISTEPSNGDKGDITVSASGLTWTVDAGVISETKLAASAVAQSKLKTSTGEVTVSVPASYSADTAAFPGGEYGLGFQWKGSTGNISIIGFYATANIVAYTQPGIKFANSDGANARTGYAKQRYVTSSGEIFWLFILRDKVTKGIVKTWSAPDHPCMGNGGKPLVVPHPFGNYDPTKHEIIVVNPNESELQELTNKTVELDEAKPDRSLLQVILEDYEVDEKGGSPDWPKKAVTVGLPPGVDWKRMPEGTVLTPIKKIIPDMGFVRRTLRLK